MTQRGPWIRFGSIPVPCSVAQWTGAHISKSPDPKTEFTGIDGLRTYIRTVPASSLPGYFGAIWSSAGRYGLEGWQQSKCNALYFSPRRFDRPLYFCQRCEGASLPHARSCHHSAQPRSVRPSDVLQVSRLSALTSGGDQNS